jgi:hypothetical protein
MRHLTTLVIALVLFSFDTLQAQNAVVTFKNGKQKKISISASSETVLMTNDGNIGFDELESINYLDEPTQLQFERCMKYGIKVEGTVPTAPPSAQMVVEYGAAKFQAIIPVDGKTAPEIYRLTNRWVATTFKNPNAATNSTLENEMVRGDGFYENGVNLGTGRADMKYSWQVDIKEGKVRFTMTDMYVLTPARFTFEMYVVKKDGSTRTNFQAAAVKESFETNANSLILSLISTLTGEQKKDSDW